MFEKLAEQQVTAVELHSYLAGFVVSRQPKPNLEVDTGDGSWRPLLDTDVFRCPPGKPSPIMLIFATEGEEEEEERYPQGHLIRARLAS